MEFVNTEFVSYDVYIPITIATIGLIAGLAAYLATKLSSVTEKVAVAESRNDSDKNELDSLWQKIESMEKTRSTDAIAFTQAIGNLNVTLGKIEVTLEAQSKIMGEIADKLHEQAKEIAGLKK